MYQRTTAINPGFRGRADEAPTVDTKPLSPQERVEKYGRYLLQTEKVARPTGDEPEFRHIRDDRQRREAVERACEQWDNAAAYRANLEAGVAARRAERDAAAQAERDAREAERGEARNAERTELEARLKREFLATAGALESDWTPELAQRLVTDHLIGERGRVDAEARESSFHRARQSW